MKNRLKLIVLFFFVLPHFGKAFAALPSLDLAWIDNQANRLICGPSGSVFLISYEFIFQQTSDAFPIGESVTIQRVGGYALTRESRGFVGGPIGHISVMDGFVDRGDNLYLQFSSSMDFGFGSVIYHSTLERVSPLGVSTVLKDESSFKSEIQYDWLQLGNTGELAYVSRQFWPWVFRNGTNSFKTDADEIRLASDGNFAFRQQIGYLATPSGVFTNTGPLGTADFVIGKRSPSGEFLWVKQVYGPGNETGVQMAVVNDGIIVSAYKTIGKTFIDSFSTSTNSGSTMIKLDPSGNVLWMREFAGDFFDAVSDDGRGGCFVSGWQDGSQISTGAILRHYNRLGELVADYASETKNMDVIWTVKYMPAKDSLVIRGTLEAPGIIGGRSLVPTGTNSFVAQLDIPLSLDASVKASQAIDLSWPNRNGKFAVQSSEGVGAEWTVAAGDRRTNATSGRIEFRAPMSERQQLFRIIQQ